MKHLGGAAKYLVSDSYETLAEAKMCLKARYGSVYSIWKGCLDGFKKNCSNPKAWMARGRSEKCDIIGKATGSLNEARYLAEEHEELSLVNRLLVLPRR